MLNQSVIYDGLTGKLVSLRNGQHHQLRSNEWKLLQLLIDNAGLDMTVPQILESVWKGRRAKSSVVTAIKNLRHQLDDRVDSPSFIQTQVMSGYVFIAQAEIITQRDVKRLLAPHRSHWIRIVSRFHHIRWQLACYLANAACLAVIVLTSLSLFRLGAFDQYVTMRQSTRVVPMIIATPNGEAPNKRAIRICNSLLFDAEQTSRLYQLPVAPEITSPHPSLTWSTHNRDLLKCHLPHINS
ncbi:winged helix family transcriptional regulator [Vibrio astriarenae]|uniref:Winged helix family transcriptional regulator n=1 Tax=Vibrio astriarenae TaxID=1481923 RepID=A0A7Z2T737_9VIBR|nr:winged helix family transcriptional regulator [Vibrio astriarenae]